MLKYAIAALMLATSTASAAEAEWFRNQQWIVAGNTDGYCAATAYFPTGKTTIAIGISADKSFRFGVDGVQATAGNKYFSIARTGKSSILLQGESLIDGSVSYGITYGDVIKLAYAKTLQIDKIGNFDMTGSMEAILELMKCRDAMTGTSI